MPRDKRDQSVLHLFSSDYRPLYLQDCFELLALPAGAVHRFRYDKAWLSLAEPALRDEIWLGLAAKKQRVLVHFVATKSTRYGQSVIMPLRWGRVAATFIEGDAYFVDFQIGGYADPAVFAAHDGDVPHPALALSKPSGNEDAHFVTRRDSVIAGTKSIHDLLGGLHPPTFFAILGSPPFASGEAAKSDATTAFSGIATVMQDLVGLRNERSGYRGHIASFFRLVSIKSTHNQKNAKVKNGLIKLRKGRSYELRTFHLNTSDVGPSEIQLELPASVNAISPTFVSSFGKYDVRDFRFSPNADESDSLGEITLRSSTSFGKEGQVENYGTTMRLPVVSVPRTFFTVLNWTIAVVTGLAAFPLALNALSSIATTSPKSLQGYANLSGWISWIDPTAFLAVAIGGLAPAALTSLAAFGVALAALFRRRWGLSPV